MAPSHDRLTKTATVVGTVAYMSPEQISGKEVDSRTDIYSLGTVLYECLLGQTPFTGEMQALIYRITHELPLSLKSLQAEVDEDVEDILMRCLEKDPAKRPGGKEIVDMLSSYKMKLHTTGRNRAMLPSSTTMSFQIKRPEMRPFVGREKEFAELQRRLNAAVSGECQFVLVGGEAGIGKTRLLEELESLAKARGTLVLHGRFVELNHSLPYQGFCEAIQEYFRSRNTMRTDTPADFSDLASDLISLFPVVAEIKELVANSEDSARPLGESGARKFEDRTYILELLARTITRMAAGKPLILLLEDLHAADVSIDALDYIVRRLGPTPTLVVGTYRSTEVDKRHPITNLLSGFKGDRRFGLIHLGPLSPSSHSIFLQRLMGGTELEEELAQKFFQATEGNPYFTTELVRSLLDSGGIVRDQSGMCRLSSETALSIEELPVTIQQTVEERIERLPKDLREVLSIASVLGRSFEFAHLEILAAENEDLESMVEQLIRSGFIEEDRQSRADRISFSSGVVRDVLYGSLPRRRRRALHRKHAEELEKRNAGRLERVYAQLFEHYSQADVPEKVIEYGFLLVRKSLETFSPDDAIRVTQTVLDFLEEEGSDRPESAEARALLASAHRMTGNINNALEELEEAIRIFEKEKQSAKVLESILSAVDIAWQGRKVEETRRWIEKGLDVAGAIADTASLSKLLSLAATVANLRGDYEKARAYLEEAEKYKPARDEVPEESVHGGTLIVALPNPCHARHPANASFNEESELLSNIFETMVVADEQGNLVPHLCERWETLNEGALFLFVLRKEVRLHDGRRLTAKDIKTAFEHSVRRSAHAMLPAFAAIRGVNEFTSGAANHITGIVALSDNIIQIQLADRLPIYPALLTDARSAVAVQSADQGDGGALYGTGPFRVSSYRSDSILLEKNVDYWKGNPPLIDAIQFHIGLTSREAAEGFRSGKYDVVRDLLPQDLDELLRDRRLHVTLVEATKKNAYFALFNSASAICSHEAVRQAMAGIARTHDLVRSSMGRFAQPAEGVLPPGILGHDPGKRRRWLSREKAIELIQSAGLPLPIRCRASVHPLIQDRYSAFQKALFQTWSDIGVEISIVTPDITSYNDSFEKNEGIDLLVGRWIADYDDPDALTYGLLHSEIGEFRSYYCSSELDHLMEESRAQNEPSIREKLYRKVDDFIAGTAYFMPLFHEIDYRLASPKVRKLALRSTPPYVNYAELAKTEEVIPSTAVKTDRGILSIPIAGNFESLDPCMTYYLWQGLVYPAMYDTLTRAAEGARVIPWIASGFQMEDDGKKFRFFLRDGVRFHDGRRLTARDVRFSFEHLLLNKDSLNRWLLMPIRGAGKLLNGESPELEGFKIISSLEFVVEMEKPLSFFPALLAYTAASIIPEGTEHFPGSWREGSVGTGAFRVVAFEPGRVLKLEANPGYWRHGLPRCDGLEFTFRSTPAEIISGFRSGRFSLAWDLFPADVDALRHDPEFASKYREIPILSTYYMVLNTKRPPFSDESLRHRLIEAVDVQGLVRRNLGRLAVPAHSMTPPGLLGYEPGITGRPSHTHKKLSEEVDISVAMHSVYESQYAEFARDFVNRLNENGFRARVNTTEAEYEKSMDVPEANLLLTRWLADYPDPDTFMHTLLHSEKGYEGRFCGTPEMDSLIEKGRTETDPTVRHSIYRQIEEIIRSQALAVPLFHEQAYCFARPKVEGLDLTFFNPYVPYEQIWLRR